MIVITGKELAILWNLSTYLARVEIWSVLRVQRCTANNAGGASGTTLREIILGQECIGIHFC